MPRIFVPPGAIAGEVVELAGEPLRRVRTVLRLRVGEELLLTDGGGTEIVARLRRLDRERGEAAILRRESPARESPLRTVLAQAVPKGDRFELALEKAVELGVSEVVPLLTRRTVPVAGGGARLERWRRIAESAVAQSGRTRVPLVHPPRPFESFCAGADGADLRVLLREGAATPFGALLSLEPAPRSVVLAAGPEGSWEEGEVRLALDRGFAAVALGPRILRSETAGLAALAVVQQRWGDLG